MTTVQIQVDDGSRPPTSNPGNLYASEVLHSHFIQILCSPKIWLPSGFTMQVQSAIPGLYIISHAIWDGRVKILAHLGVEWQGGELKDLLIAYGRIVEQPLAPIRFMHKDSQGRRIVTGDARPIDDSNSERDAESGE